MSKELLKEAKNQERLNQYGVMEDSVLNVDLICGSNFPSLSYYVMINMDESQKYETKPT
jgi:hypothetical protein